jgi:hypothetical protein
MDLQRLDELYVIAKLHFPEVAAAVAAAAAAAASAEDVAPAAEVTLPKNSYDIKPFFHPDAGIAIGHALGRKHP